jgi:uncharacterized delta-60 repeat protein
MCSRARRSRAASSVAFLGVTLLAAGCATVLGFEDTTLRTGVNSDGGPIDSGGPVEPDGEVTPEAAPSRLTATPTSLVVRRGGTADITVEVARGADVTGTVTARLTNLPGGVTAKGATLDPPATSGKVTLTAASAATLGPKTINLVADGTSLPPASIALLVADASGALDTTFGADGFVSDPSTGLGATFLALAQQTDGRIVAGGTGGPVGGPLAGWMVRRYATDGAPDSPFNTASAGVPADGELRAMVIDGAGNIICVGSTVPPLSPPLTPAVLTIVRLLPTGALDTSFAGGTVRLPAEEGPNGSIGLGVAVQADGSVVVVGSRRDALNVEDGVIARFKTNGTRDPAFNGGATIIIPAARLVGVTVDAAGPILAAGSTASGTLPSYLLTRRTAQGAADPTFGTAGTATFGNTYGANGFTRLADGTIVLVGDVQQGAAAYTAGTASENGTAIVARAVAVAPGAGFFGVAVQDGARFIAAGHTATLNGEARVERINFDGSLDATFGTAGAAILEPGGVANGFEVTLFSAVVQTDARILVAGNRSNAGAIVYRLWQ